MKIKPFIKCLVSEYIKHTYPQEYIVYIYYHSYDNEEMWTRKFCKENNIDFYDVVLNEHIILQFDTEKEAIDFCNSVPDSSPYCVVYSYGKLIHENT